MVLRHGARAGTLWTNINYIENLFGMDKLDIVSARGSLRKPANSANSDTLKQRAAAILDFIQMNIQHDEDKDNISEILIYLCTI